MPEGWHFFPGPLIYDGCVQQLKSKLETICIPIPIQICVNFDRFLQNAILPNL